MSDIEDTNYPLVGQSYNLQEILKDLDLPDSPFLMVTYGDLSGAVQTSHVTDDQFLSVPGIRETVWRYSHTTSESWAMLYSSMERS